MTISTQLARLFGVINDFIRPVNYYLLSIMLTFRNIDCVLSSIGVFLYFKFTQRYYNIICGKLDKCIKKIAPNFNTMVIFSTNDFTNHGHPNPLKCPKNMSRKSVATYYFSRGRPLNEIAKVIKKNTTVFKGRHGDKNDVSVKREYIKNMLRNFKFYQNLKKFEKNYLRTGKTKRKRVN